MKINPFAAWRNIYVIWRGLSALNKKKENKMSWNPLASKTIWVIILAIVTAVTAYLNGELSMLQTIMAILAALGLGGMRHAQAKGK